MYYMYNGVFSKLQKSIEGDNDERETDVLLFCIKSKRKILIFRKLLAMIQLQ